MKKKPYEWAVVGAGPAGIAAVGKLIDNGIPPETILWLDPYFKVGDLGRYWRNISSNTTVQRFIDFLDASQAFDYKNAPDFHLNHLPKKNTCVLNDIVEPLQWISDHLCKQVTPIQAIVNTLSLSNQQWSLQTNNCTSYAKNVILSTGAEPRYLDHSTIETVPFEIAMDKSRLSEYVDINDTYAVFGSSHSAVIAINYLIDLGVKKVINFYRSPLCYAIDMGDWILFDNTGLKGHSATWARAHIDGTLPMNLIRYNSTNENLSNHLPSCDKAIYAVGFKRRNSVVIDGYTQVDYNPTVGIIAPGLFGLGIAYPELKSDPFGNKEYQVGLWKFMVYLNKVLPIWLRYSA